MQILIGSGNPGKVDEVAQFLQGRGFEAVSGEGYLSGNLALPRKQEIYACVNRYRGLKL